MSNKIKIELQDKEIKMLGLESLLNLRQVSSEYIQKSRVTLTRESYYQSHKILIDTLEESLTEISKLKDKVKALEEELSQEKKNIKTVIRYSKR